MKPFESQSAPGVVAQDLQPVGDGRLAVQAAPEGSPLDLDFRAVTRLIDGDPLVLDGSESG